ncbi:MAG: Ada metal-binding domain-containing protein [Deltaproteobacteria bacterium]|nr:Ada metal-binding domain-containing protein [Deltaproteobacteria bacterium]
MNEKIPIVFFAVALFASIAAGVVVAQSVIYHGNTKSHIFHKPSCRYYNCKDCTAEFTSREDAIAAGYRPCRVCNP